MGLTGHPGYRRLSRFADHELGPRDHARVADHLADCARCRDEVAFIRQAAAATRSLPTPRLDPGGIEAILARRQAGERVLLPARDEGARASGRSWTRAAIAALLVLFAGSLIVSVGVLSADRPALRIEPARPRAGDALTMEYHGGGLFADQDRLRLRVRFRAAGDRWWQTGAGRLERGDDGVFRGQLILPDSAVFAAFAVEDTTGARLDSDDRRLWDVVVHDADGHPTLPALRARVEDRLGRDPGEAHRTALRMTRLYADSAESWATRLAVETRLLDADSVRAALHEPMARLERRVSTSPPDGDELGWLAMLAIDLGDRGVADGWIREADRRGLTAPVVQRARVLLLGLRGEEDPAVPLARLEQLWQASAVPIQDIAEVGVELAGRTGDPDALERWLPRYWRLHPTGALLPIPAPAVRSLPPDFLQDVGDRALRRLEPAEDDLRPLRSPLAEYRRALRRSGQRTLATVAEAALAGGSDRGRAVAVGLAHEAVTLAWETPALESLGRVLLATGDTAVALDAFARAAADPAHGVIPASIRSAPSWKTQVDRAQDGLLEYVLAGAVIRYPDPGLEIDGAAGPVRLRSLLGGRPAVVGFVSRYPGLARITADDLPRLADAVSSRDARLILIEGDPGPSLRPRLAARGLDVPIYTDPRGDARSQFQVAAAPSYFVVDGHGRIRFEHSTLAEIPRQLDALQAAGVGEPPPLVAEIEHHAFSG